MSYEFECNDKKCFIKDLSHYYGISFEEHEKWSSKEIYYSINLYFLKKYCDTDGCISISKDYDYFYFDDKEIALKIYEDIKQLLKS